MSLQLIRPVELLTAACVCPKTQSQPLVRGRSPSSGPLLLAPLLVLGMTTHLAHPNGSAKKQGGE